MKFVLAAAVATAGFGGAALAQTDGAPSDAPTNAEKLIANCDAHKFETTIQTIKGGKPHSSKVKLCGEEGQSDAEWLVTLKDALQKVQSNPTMPAEVKAQIAVALRSEIAKVERVAAAPVAELPEIAPRPSSGPASAVAQPPVAIPVAEAPVATPAPRPAAAAPAKPRLSLECYTPGDLGGAGPCTTLTRDTLVTIRAGAPLPSGYSVRFVSRGETRGEIALQPMGKGQLARVRLPAETCSGGGAPNVELQVVAAGQLADTRGPFILRC